MAFSHGRGQVVPCIVQGVCTHAKSVCGQGRWWVVKYSRKINKHHVPWVLTHSVLLRRDKHHRKVSHQEDTTELLASASLTTCRQSSRHCGGARPQGPATGHPDRGSCYGLTHHFLSHPPIYCTPDTCKQKRAASLRVAPTGSQPFQKARFSWASLSSTGPSQD